MNRQKSKQPLIYSVIVTESHASKAAGPNVLRDWDTAVSTQVFQAILLFFLVTSHKVQWRGVSYLTIRLARLLLMRPLYINLAPLAQPIS